MKKLFAAALLILTLTIADRIVLRPELHLSAAVFNLLVLSEHLGGFFALVAAAGTAPAWTFKLLQVRPCYPIAAILGIFLLVLLAQGHIPRVIRDVTVKGVLSIIIIPVAIWLFDGVWQGGATPNNRRLLANIAVIASIVASLGFEISQATGWAPYPVGGRGYVQWDQVAVDILGALAGWAIAATVRSRLCH